MTMPGFDAPETTTMSYGRRVTAAKNAAIERGVNPATGLELREPVGAKTCGDCWHAITKGRGFWKCELGRLSNSATTDIRLSWPACRSYSATDDGKGIAPNWVQRKVNQ